MIPLIPWLPPPAGAAAPTSFIQGLEWYGDPRPLGYNDLLPTSIFSRAFQLTFSKRGNSQLTSNIALEFNFSSQHAKTRKNKNRRLSVKTRTDAARNVLKKSTHTRANWKERWAHNFITLKLTCTLANSQLSQISPKTTRFSHAFQPHHVLKATNK